MDPVQERSSKMAEIKCECGRCDCVICSPEIIKQREAARHKSSMECCDPLAHADDCDCVDCLCEPCAVYDTEADGDTSKPHPAECDCLQCLCEPCADMEYGCDQPNKPDESKTLAETLKCSREASCREILKDRKVEHPPGCECIVCRCCDFQEGDTKVHIPRKFPPKVCTCEECRCLIESPPIFIQQIAIIQSDVERKVEEKMPEEREAHIPECDCVDCLLVCDTACPDPTVAHDGVLPDIDSTIFKQCGKPQKEKLEDEEKISEAEEGLEPEHEDGAASIHTENAEVELDAESLERQREITELQDVIKQIQCACYEAELQAAKSLPTPNPFVVKQKSCYEDTFSGLQLALSSLQDKCKQKDRMIAAMTKELKLRANSKVFSDMLQRINQLQFDENEIVVDFDRKEVCDSLPRPICDPKYGKPSNQLGEPLICQPCEHPDYPNCPCKNIQQAPSCSHPNYPNCPCKTVQDQPAPIPFTPSKSIPPEVPSIHSKHVDVSCQCSKEQCKPSAEKFTESRENEEIPAEVIAEDEQPPLESKADVPKCEHPDYPNCPCKKENNDPPSSSPSQPKPICDHPDFPRCPCVPGYNKSPLATEHNESAEDIPVTEQNDLPENIPEETLETEKISLAEQIQTQPKPTPSIDPHSSQPNEHQTDAELPPCLLPRKLACICKPITKSAASMPAHQTRETSPDRANKKHAKSQKKCLCKDKNKTHKHCSLPNAAKKLRSRPQSPSCVCHTHSNSFSPPFGILKDGGKPSTSGRKSSNKSDKLDRDQEVILKESNLDESDSFKSPPDCSCPEKENARPTSAGKQSASFTPLTNTVKIEISPLASSSPDLCSCYPDDSNKPELNKVSSTKLQPPPGEIISSSPMEVTDIRRISPDSLLIKWAAPTSKYVIGYEILVDGVIKSRVRSPERTSAVLHTLNIRDVVNIMIYAITTVSRCQPPAIAIYQL